MLKPNSQRFPIFIPSKGRHQFMMTSKNLTRMGIDHNVVVEPQEAAQYRAAADNWKLRCEIIELDMAYKQRFETCDELGTTKSTGSGPARNFIWDLAIAAGYDWHWIMDDNIRHFRRLNLNEKVVVT